MQQNLFRKHKVVFLCLLLSIFSVGFAQNNPLVLSWDKPGCQQDTINKISFDENFSNLPCLKVCKSTIVTYKISGEFMENVDYVKWYPIGGEKLDERDLPAMPIMWNNETSAASLRIVVVLLNAQTIEKTICVNKLNTSLIFGWDRIGCQISTNSVSEIKLDNSLTDIPCLKVCHQSKITYTIFGQGSENIESVVWDVTGGNTDAVTGGRQMSLPVSWDDSADGLIQLHIVYNNGSIVDRSICVEKIDSSLLLDWEKIPESSVREIKFNNDPNIPESIMVYPESTVLYKLDGKDLTNIDSVNWTIVGGYGYYPNPYTAIVTWEDAESNSLQVNVLLKDNTNIIRNISVVKKESDSGGENALNAIKFTYDEAGNQIRRNFIYLARIKNQNDTTPKNSVKQLYKSEEYEDISYYPNPVRSELYLQWKNRAEEKLVSINVYDLNGRLVKLLPDLNDSENTTINFESYPAGVYELLLHYNSGEKKTLKVVKQ
jgi:hypothetical protein